VNNILVGFKSGLDRLEGQMLPIYNLTGKLRETQKNIDLSVQELRAVNENFTMATEVRKRALV
jgi:exocyst complex protein 7